jgi:hypothetical protein
MTVNEGVIRGLVGRRINHIDEASDHREGKYQSDDERSKETLR